MQGQYLSDGRTTTNKSLIQALLRDVPFSSTIPLLKHVPRPLAAWKREVQDRGKEEASANMALVNMVKNDGREAPPSLCKLLLETKVLPLSDRDFAYVPGSLFGAGSDTTASTLRSAFLAIVTHPSVLALAHKEFDTIIGSSRCPRLDDEPRLPYIRALCKEVLRWRPVAVLGGTPHASTTKDVYLGYHIPAATKILCHL